MSAQAPSLLSSGEGVTTEKARLEVLAHAFSVAAGDYFDREVTYESNITNAEERKSRKKSFRRFVVGASVAAQFFFFGVLVVAFVAESTFLFLVVGVIMLTILGIAVLVWMNTTSQIEEAEQRIEENRRKLKKNTPDGSVSFVSQISMPLYLVPYGDEHMVFDGVDNAPTTEISIADIDGDALIEAGDDLEARKAEYDRQLANEEVLSPEKAEQLVTGAKKHRCLERPVIEQLNTMTGIARSRDVETIRVGVHANNEKTNSIQKLAREDLLKPGTDIPMVETALSLKEAQGTVRELSGVEEVAVSGDLLEIARTTKDRVNETTRDLRARHETNAELVDAHWSGCADIVGQGSQKRVCPACLAEEYERVDEDLNIVENILEEGGSFGAALGDDDLDRIGDGSFTISIRQEIEDELPTPDENLKNAFSTLEAVGSEGVCEEHGDIQPESIPEDSQVFAEVWRSLYYMYRDPIMENVYDLEQEAEDVRRDKEQKIQGLTEFEQILDQTKLNLKSTESEYETAKAITREF